MDGWNKKVTELDPKDQNTGTSIKNGKLITKYDPN